MKRTIPLVLAIVASPAIGEDTRQMDAHEHGVGVLNIAMDGTLLTMEFHAPGADIVGFEYVSETEADQGRVDDAIVALKQPLDLFSLPDAAGCAVTQAAADLEVEGAHEDEEDHHDDHDDHAEHGHSDEEHEEKHEDAASHTEFHAEYQLTCADPSALTEMTFAYFDVFENAREVEVQIVTNAGAQAFEVMRDAPTLSLADMF